MYFGWACEDLPWVRQVFPCKPSPHVCIRRRGMLRSSGYIRRSSSIGVARAESIPVRRCTRARLRLADPPSAVLRARACACRLAEHGLSTAGW